MDDARGKSVELLCNAKSYLAQGNLTAGDFLARDALDLDPDSAEAYTVLGIIAATLGLQECAIDYFGRAASLSPNDSANLENLRMAKTLNPPRAADQTRYLLSKAWGYGFWADVSHVLGCLLLAEITHRKPIVHWGTNSLFNKGTDKDAFQAVFSAFYDDQLIELQSNPNVTFYPPKWNSGNLLSGDINKSDGKHSRMGGLYFLNRPETVAVCDFYIGVVDIIPWVPKTHPLHGKTVKECYRSLASAYLRPRQEVIATRDRFLAENLGNAPFVAIHLRGSDKVLEEPTLADSHHACLTALSAVDTQMKIFTLTDDDKLLRSMREIYGERIVATECMRTDSNQGVHYLPNAKGPERATEVLLDTLLALEAHTFIGTGRSAVSAMISMLKDWAPGRCILVDQSRLAMRNIYIHG
jgi:tetratricopeptide (TPR) repeat protein